MVLGDAQRLVGVVPVLEDDFQQVVAGPGFEPLYLCHVGQEWGAASAISAVHASFRSWPENWTYRSLRLPKKGSDQKR